MKRIITLSFLFFTGILFSYGQPAIEWQYSYGGTLKDGFTSGNVQQDQVDVTTDGGYIFAGFSYSDDGDVFGHHGLSSTTDCWVVKLDSLGGIDWQRSLGGTGDELGYSVRQTSDGGYIVVSSTTSDDGDVTGVHYDSTGTQVADLWVVKLDAQGNIVWERAYGGSEFDLGYSVIETYDGNFLIVGRTRSDDGDVSGYIGGTDIWMLKIDNIGNILWQKCIGGTLAEYAYNVRETADHGFVLCGNVSSSDGDFTGTTGSFLGSVFVLKTDSVANIEWVQVFGGNLFEWGFQVEQTPDGGYAFGVNCGSSDIPGHHGSLDYWFLRLDNTGAIIWQQCYGGSDSDWFKAFQAMNDGGYVLIGLTTSTDGDVSNSIGSQDVWLVKIDSVGSIQWEKSYGGSEPDDGTSVIATPDGGLLMAVESNSNDFDVSGHHGAVTESDCWIAKLAPLTTGMTEINDNITTFSVSPNPAVNSSQVLFSIMHPSRISISVIDIAGRSVSEIYLGRLPSGEHVLGLNELLSGTITNGIYFIRLNDESNSRTLKFVVNR